MNVRIDILSIFPDYLTPLELSLAGRARDKGLLDIEVHDLRNWAHDRHRTVDDTPYGGGAGMVMKPEPWGEALDALIVEDQRPILIFTTPSGVPFTQRVAHELAQSQHLIFACGRYEGIDQRVIDHGRAAAEVREISIGDYVLNGGEVAALAITEAVVRLLPGFMGNPESLTEESHQDGLLEYPVYTKPSSWRGHEVPAVLLGGNHGAIADWRLEQARCRTAERRPDLLAAASLPGDGEIAMATIADAGEILTLSLASSLTKQRAYPTVLITAQDETLRDVRDWLDEWTVLTMRRDGRLVAAVRGRLEGESAWSIDRLMTAPDLEGQGLERAILAAIEAVADPRATSYALTVTAGDAASFKRAGYRGHGQVAIESGTVVLTKRISR